MSPQIEAALIAAIVSIISLGGTIVVALRGFQATRQATSETLLAQREQLDRTLAEQHIRTLNGRFSSAAEQLGLDKPATVRLAGVYSMAGLADDWEENRQICIDVLCGYLRMPYLPDSSSGQKRLDFLADKEVRHTVIRVITAHLRDGTRISWRDNVLDFTGVTFDGGDFSGARFCGNVKFNEAKFSAGVVNFSGVEFSHSLIDFHGAEFSGGTVDFGSADFSAAVVSFDSANFSDGLIKFSRAVFNSSVSFDSAKFSGGTIDFSIARFLGLMTFSKAEFSGSAISFSEADFDGSIHFNGSQFSGGKIDFNRALFERGIMNFNGAEFTGSTVSFKHAEFSGCTIDLSHAKVGPGWNQLQFDLPADESPDGVMLPRRFQQNL